MQLFMYTKMYSTGGDVLLFIITIICLRKVEI